MVLKYFFFQVSNVLFFLFPPVLMHLFQQYAKFVNPAINILWVLLMIIGVSSAYFHATLSLVGKNKDLIAKAFSQQYLYYLFAYVELGMHLQQLVLSYIIIY